MTPSPSFSYKEFVLPFLLVLVTTIVAAQDAGARPWDASFRASFTERVNILRSDSLYQVVNFTTTGARLATITGDTLALATMLQGLQGSVVLVDFWGTFCPPCLKVFPELYRLMDKLENEPFELVFVNVDDRVPDWERFSKRYPVGNKKHNYRLENKEVLAEMLALRSVPRYLLFDQQGRLCNAYVPAPGKGLEGYVRELLLER